MPTENVAHRLMRQLVSRPSYTAPASDFHRVGQPIFQPRGHSTFPRAGRRIEIYLHSRTEWPSPVAQPLRGGRKIRICDFCDVGWGPGDKFFYVRLRGVGFMGGGKVYIIALPAGKSLPTLPPSGIRSAEDFKDLNVVSVIDMTGLSVFAPGPNPSTYAYSRMTVHRNLFRIPLN